MSAQLPTAGGTALQFRQRVAFLSIQINNLCLTRPYRASTLSVPGGNLVARKLEGRAMRKPTVKTQPACRARVQTVCKPAVIEASPAMLRRYRGTVLKIDQGGIRVFVDLR